MCTHKWNCVYKAHCMCRALCMYVCMYIYICIYIYTQTHTHSLSLSLSLSHTHIIFDQFRQRRLTCGVLQVKQHLALELNYYHRTKPLT